MGDVVSTTARGLSMTTDNDQRLILPAARTSIPLGEVEGDFVVCSPD